MPEPFANVKIEGIDVTPSLRLVEVEDSDRLIDKATIVLDDADEAASDVFREGQKVLIDLGWNTEHAVLFEGLIVRSTVTAQTGQPQRLTLTAYDLSYQMMQGPPQITEYQGSLSSILQQLCTRRPYGFTVGQIVPSPDPTFTAESPLRQAGLRDWEFIQQLAVRYSCRAYVEYNQDRSQFYFVPESRLFKAQAMGTIAYNHNTGPLLRFTCSRLASAAAPVRTVTVRDGSGQAKTSTTPKLAPAAPAPPDPARLAKVGAGAQKYAQAQAKGDAAAHKPEEQRPQQIVQGLPSDPDRAQLAVAQDPTRAEGYRGEGEVVGTIHLRAKGKVSLTGVASWAVGDWYVHRATHVFTRAIGPQRGTYRTRFVATR